LIGGHPEEVTVVFATAAEADSFVEVRGLGEPDSTRHDGSSAIYSLMQVATGRHWDEELPGPPESVAKCNSEQYKDPNCIYESPYMHTVRVQGLKPGSNYEYRPNGQGRWRRFQTAPAVGERVSFGVLGDLGTTGDSLKTMQHMASKLESGDFHMALFMGDLSYADGYGEFWDLYGRQGEFLWDRLPTAYMTGNHEFQHEQNVHYTARYPAPGRARKQSKNDLWYSFDAGLAHVVVLCSYCDTRRASHQYRWLERDLASFDRARTPWLVVSTYIPWYTSNRHHSMEESARMRGEMEGLIYSYRADVFFSGHLHSYERTYGVARNSTTCDGPVHIVIGDGGNHEGPACHWSAAQFPEWEAFREYSFGHGVFDIVNATHAQWTWHRNHDKESVFADSVWLQPAAFHTGGGAESCRATTVAV
jgi:hypothetical protein